MSNFTDTRNILKSFLCVIAGVWAYCLVIAPIFSDQAYAEVAASSAKNIGIGFTLVALLICALWIAVVRKKNS